MQGAPVIIRRPTSFPANKPRDYSARTGRTPGVRSCFQRGRAVTGFPFGARLIVSFAIVAGTMTLSPRHALADDEATATALAVVDAHLANLDSFERFTCRYTQTATRAKTVEDALAGRYFSEFGPPRTAQLLWAKDGSK